VSPLLKPWLFDIFMYTGDPRPQCFDPVLCQQLYDQYLDRWTRAEAHGLEGIFFSEHHFTTFNLSPSPNLLIAAVAQRTNRLRLGVMCNVLHLHDPRRLAEECAMLDYLTRGRLEIGVGAGGNPVETLQAGLDPAEIRTRFASGLAVLEAAMAGPFVTQQDAFVHLDHVPIRPRPRQQPRPSIWMTSLSAESAERAARRGSKLALAWAPVAALRHLAETYLAAGAENPATGPESVAFRRRVFVAPSQAEAEDLVHSAPDAFLDGTVEATNEQVRGYLSQAEDIIVGTPAIVAEILIEQARQIHSANVLLWTDFRAFEVDALNRCHELIGKQVVPALRQVPIHMT
jgi:alkanesulfonate monooxygenase SsuD/methylene tetrahydromethanopterin reductase-like flavin-dependent oxidoreductase (luciferase family)